jgi:hypothetical protein
MGSPRRDGRRPRPRQLLHGFISAVLLPVVVLIARYIGAETL